jgi:hypothetical protein
MGNYFKFFFSPLTIGLDEIARCEQITYLGVVINAGRTMKFDTAQTRLSFFIARNSIFSCAPKTNELLHLGLQETYSLPLLLYAALAVDFTARQLRVLKLLLESHLSSNIWESVNLFVCGLGRFDLRHLLWIRRTKFYRHLAAINSNSLHVLYQNYCFYYYNLDICLKLVQLSNSRAQDYIYSSTLSTSCSLLVLISL